MSGLLIVYTGNGKGKTSAAIGAVVRTLGNGGRVALIQFMKGAMKSSERDLFRARFPEQVELISADIGFFRDETERSLQSDNAAALWQKVRLSLRAQPPFDLIVLDELNYVLYYGLLDESMVLEDLQKRGSTHVVVTGRYASQKMVALADTVSELQEIRHAHQAGVSAVPGIDY